MPLNLLVCLKQIPNPDLQFAIAPSGKDIKRETLNYKTNGADEYALESTHNAPAFIGAMEKLADQNLSELQPEPWVEYLLYTHPPIQKRLDLARAFASH